MKYAIDCWLDGHVEGLYISGRRSYCYRCSHTWHTGDPVEERFQRSFWDRMAIFIELIEERAVELWEEWTH